MSAITVAAEPELSRDEFATAVARLAERLADLATERNGARADWAEALEAACTLQQDLDRERRRADEQTAMAFDQAKLAARFRDRFAETSTELLRLKGGWRDLAVRAETAELQAERLQARLDKALRKLRRRRWRPWRRSPDRT